ncbi:uncharacterized short protein YbdD (DUF466 family) [Microbacterium telephonicum]|uniref:Uncharacterized short protein YbdD (DUF466 family) n=1 Tax=Microbacterium telephonicum TaxID=1714841 RepID=A0A498CCM2_9MICO|nr:uncharacterized short protein YbdD (DUF466 family) [Microbacterium telephonicum]
MDTVHNSGDPTVETGGRPLPHPFGGDTPELWTPSARAARAGRAIARAAHGVHWYVTALMGDNAYATYVAHQRRHHPHAPVPTVREFWRARMDEQDRNPGARCC